MRQISGFALALLLCLLIGLGGCGDGDEGGASIGANTSQGDGVGSTSDIQEVDSGAGTDVSAQSDSEAADTAQDDVGSADTGEADIGGEDIGATCPGGEGCPCSENSDCDNSICLDTAAGKRCGKTCVEDCPKGFTCGKLGAADATFVCIPNHLTTCSPCTSNADCQYQQADAICLDYGDVGRFCGGPCKVDDDCPSADYACISVLDEGTG